MASKRKVQVNSWRLLTWNLQIPSMCGEFMGPVGLEGRELYPYLHQLFFIIFFNLIFLYTRFLLVIYFIHIHVSMSIPISQFIPLPPPPTFPSWCPYVCSLYLSLYFCLADRFICTIFLDSAYMR